MAVITRWTPFRHLRSDPNVHVLHYRGGKLVRSGRGLAFWFLPLSASIAEIPCDDRDEPFLFHGRSRDFQDVTAQGSITYRIVDPESTAARIDFTIDPQTGTTTFVTVVTGADFIEAMAFSPSGVLYATGAPTSTVSDTLYTLDLETGVLTVVGHMGSFDVDTLTWAVDGLLSWTRMENAFFASKRYRDQTSFCLLPLRLVATGDKTQWWE